MKELLPTAFMILLGACSANAKQDSSEPGPSGTSTTPSGSTATTPMQPSTPPTKCPALQIKAPDVVPAGQSGQVALTLTDAGGTPTYSWAVDGGTIESGQGTASVSIRSASAVGKPITATVTLGNLPAECETKSASATFVVGG